MFDFKSRWLDLEKDPIKKINLLLGSSFLGSDLLFRGSLFSGGLLGSLLSRGLLGSLLCCGLLSSLLNRLLGLFGSRLLDLLNLLGLFGLDLLDLFDLLGFLNLANLEFTSSLASLLSFDDGSGSKSLPEGKFQGSSNFGLVNLVVGHDILEDGLAG